MPQPALPMPFRALRSGSKRPLHYQRLPEGHFPEHGTGGGKGWFLLVGLVVRGGDALGELFTSSVGHEIACPRLLELAVQNSSLLGSVSLHLSQRHFSPMVVEKPANLAPKVGVGAPGGGEPGADSLPRNVKDVLAISKVARLRTSMPQVFTKRGELGARNCRKESVNNSAENLLGPPLVLQPNDRPRGHAVVANLLAIARPISISSNIAVHAEEALWRTLWDGPPGGRAGWEEHLGEGGVGGVFEGRGGGALPSCDALPVQLNLHRGTVTAEIVGVVPDSLAAHCTTGIVQVPIEPLPLIRPKSSRDEDLEAAPLSSGQR